MEVRELRIGNLVSYDNRVFEIDTIAKEFPTLNTIDFGIGVVDWNNIKPIPITEEWLLKLPKNIKFPEWIKSLHELQNWYYWNNNKKELLINL